MPDKPLPVSLPNSAIQCSTAIIPWIWDGIIALGAITLLSAPEKIGKTTLLSLLLDRRRAGGQLLGRTVQAGKTIVCTEESERLWCLRQPPLDFGPDVLFRQPFDSMPNADPWQQFIDRVCDRCLEDEDPHDLLVIDTAVRFLPLAQRNKRPLRAALAQLEMLTRVPLGVLIINQSRTVHRPLAAFADIVIEMSVPRGRAGSDGPTRRRILTGVGRYPETLQNVQAELNLEGTDYTLVSDIPPPRSPLLTVLRSLLAESPTPLTHHELLTRWPAPAPHPDSLWRTLAAGVQRGLFTTTGKGTKTEPFRFGLA